MKNIFVFLVMSLLLSCQAQEHNKPQKDVPKGKWQVHKKFDANGNLIAYDSVYTYSSFNDKYGAKDIDSIVQQFQQHFSQVEGLPWKQSFSFFPDTDSTFKKHFSDTDFFQNAWKEQNFDVDRMLKQMDSIRELFLRDFYEHRLKNKQKTPKHTL